MRASHRGVAGAGDRRHEAGRQPAPGAGGSGDHRFRTRSGKPIIRLPGAACKPRSHVGRTTLSTLRRYAHRMGLDEADDLPLEGTSRRERAGAADLPREGTSRRERAVARVVDPARARAETRVQRFLDAASELMSTTSG